MASMTFSIWRLQYEQKKGKLNAYPNKDFFKDLKTFQYKKNNKKLYRVIIEKHSEYVYFSVNWGSTNPRDDKIINIDTEKAIDNPRGKNWLEFQKQFFAMYDYKTELFYISNVNNRSLFLELINRELNSSLVVKGIYNSREEFIKLLKTVNEIKFSNTSGLFSENSQSLIAMKNLTYSNADTEFEIDIKYKKLLKDLRFVKELFKESDKNHLHGLMIRGLDEKGFEHVFNIDGFIKKIILDVQKNQSGKYDETFIKESLLKKISELTS